MIILEYEKDFILIKKRFKDFKQLNNFLFKNKIENYSAYLEKWFFINGLMVI